MLKKYYTSSELARLCNVHQVTIFRALENGRIKASTTPGGHYRIRHEDAETFLKENNIPLSVMGTKMLRILIIEDNPLELKLYQRALQRLKGVEILATTSGYDGGFLTKDFSPDLILLDIRLKDADGCDIAQTIRKDEELKGTCIVAITGIKEPSEIKRVKECGIDYILHKPVSKEDLRNKVKKYLHL